MQAQQSVSLPYSTLFLHFNLALVVESDPWLREKSEAETQHKQEDSSQRWRRIRRINIWKAFEKWVFYAFGTDHMLLRTK